jgi:hypothetical protein
MNKDSFTTQGSRILPCNCTNVFQDAQYGPGKRVHNLITKTPGDYRCTACGHVRSPRSSGVPTITEKQRKKMGAKKSGLKASGKQGRKKKVST